MRGLGYLAGSILLLSSCVTDSQTRLNTAKWEREKLGLVSYSYKLTRRCFCIPEYGGPFLIEATPHSVTKVRRIETGTEHDTVVVTVDIQSFSIDSLIADARVNLDSKPASANIRYHLAYGFPEHVYIDFSLTIVDEEYGWEITDFEAIAGD
jgi:hypothetical protein